MLPLSFENIIVQLILSIPTFFILKWVLKRIIHNPKVRIISTWIGTIILTPLVFTLFWIIMIYMMFHESKDEFDKELWVSNSNQRFHMADDIINKKMLIDKDSNQVKLILGNPDWRYKPKNHWVYEMGSGGGGLGFVFNNLYISFEHNKVDFVKHIRVQD